MSDEKARTAVGARPDHCPLHGWDDEKVYFGTGVPGVGELCVSDEQELMEELVRMCWEYYRRRGVVGRDASKGK